MTRQHHKGKKRPRAWHRTAKEGRKWLGHLTNLENKAAHLERKLNVT